jgi:uncharacterized repeat protein (TIGR01451 family)
MSVVRFARAAWQRPPRASLWAGLCATAFLLVAVGSSVASHISGVDGHTTLERIVTGDKPGRCGTPQSFGGAGTRASCSYSELRSEVVSGTRVVRDGASEGNDLPTAQSGRSGRRQSLAYFGQLTDFQLADEETPAKVEFLDGEQDRECQGQQCPGASSAWRPQEAFQPFIVDQSIRQMNLFAGESPVAQGNGNRAAMDFALMTGDQADSAQRNETIWVRELLEGGQPLNFNSGIEHNLNYSAEHPSCASVTPDAAEAAAYTGVQDYEDYDESQTPNYYDPNIPTGFWANPDSNALTNDSWPTYTGLMDRAQQLTITPEGSAVPTYVTNGNHDPLVQGNEDAIKSFEDIAMGCFKALTTTAPLGPGVIQPDPDFLLSPGAFMLIPPDPLRRYVSKPQIREVYGADGEDNAHGFGFVDIEELRASCPVALQVQCNQSDATARKHGSASYYAWDPPESPGFRFISIDTVSEGGQTAEGLGCGSAAGNIDDPQWQWLTDELDAATAQQKLIVLFGHHPVRSLCTEIRDEQASQCTTDRTHNDDPEHDQNPGCDIDPRPSDPIHLGCDPAPPEEPGLPEFHCDPDRGDPRESFVELLENYPHVIAYVAGHTHDNKVLPCGTPVNNNGTPTATDDFGGCTEGGNWWEINTAATSDWPVQHRLVEVMDNHDGTLSIFGTLLDHRGAGEAPAPGSAATFNGQQLAAIGSEFAYNDPQAGNNTGEGVAKDQNVELVVDDPRAADLALTKTDSPDPVSVGGVLTYTLEVTNSGATTNGVTLTDTLPKNVQFRSASSEQGRCTLRRPRTVECNLGDVPQSEPDPITGDPDPITITIEVRPTKAGSITNTATVRAGWPNDPVLVNNAASATTQVNP